MTAVVVVGLALLVFAAVALLFLSTGGAQISKIEAEQIYRTKCQAYCDQTDAGKNAALVGKLTTEKNAEFQKFLLACDAAGIPWRDSAGENPSRCLEACPCNMKLTAGQVTSDTLCSARCVDTYKTPQQQNELKSCMEGC